MTRAFSVGLAATFAAAISVPCGAAHSTVRARALCLRDAAGPVSTIPLNDAGGRRVATATIEPCGPASSLLDITPIQGGRLAADAALVRRGTCQTPSSLPAYDVGVAQSGPTEANPQRPFTAARLKGTKFSVELMHFGSAAPFACGSHRGALLLPEPPRSGRADATARRIASETFVARSAGAIVRLTPANHGRATRVMVNASSSSSGEHVHLRPGTCALPVAGHEIVLQPLVSDFPSSTLVALPPAALVDGRYSLEIHVDGYSFSAAIDSCIDL